MTDASPPRAADGHQLVSPAQLLYLLHNAEQGKGPAVRVLDVRWRLDRPEGRPEYVRAHLPGAVYVDLEGELARKGQPEEGRHPLPRFADLQRAVRGWGVREGDVVVAYDDNRGVAAARLWWLLRRAGADVRVLDGGIRAWVAEGLPLSQGDVLPETGDISLRESEEGEISRSEVEAFSAQGVLLDVRTPEQYSGVSLSLDPVGGHIPGAVNLPALAVATSDGRLQHPDALRRIFAGAGATVRTPVAVYCGSGIASSLVVLALSVAGLPARLYPGSWSEWSNTRGLTAAVGILPAGRLTRT